MWDVNDAGFDTPGATAGLSYLRDLVDIHNLIPADVTAEVTNTMFTAGRSAMVLANPAMVQSYKTAGIHTGVARIPALPNGKYPHPLATYTGISVSAYSKHPDEAKALAVYLGDKLPELLYKANPVNNPNRSNLDEFSFEG
jgi:arabinogalactan oligomer/maltooligosaccharide transport system substrate-binding protein